MKYSTIMFWTDFQQQQTNKLYRFVYIKESNQFNVILNATCCQWPKASKLSLQTDNLEGFRFNGNLKVRDLPPLFFKFLGSKRSSTNVTSVNREIIYFSENESILKLILF